MYYHQVMNDQELFKRQKLLYRVVACFLFLLVISTFIFAYSQFSKRYSLPIDIDYADGEILQVYVTHPDGQSFSMRDWVLKVDNISIQELQDEDLTASNEIHKVTLIEADGTQHNVKMHSVKPTTLMLLELLSLPILGLIFVIPGFVMLLLRPTDKSVSLFFLFSFFIGIFTNTSQLSRLGFEWITGIHYISIILATWNYIEFHLTILEFHPISWFVWVLRSLKVTVLIFLTYALITGFEKWQHGLTYVLYADIIFTFVYILLIFLGQISHNEFRKGIVRALFITNISAILPLVVFSYIPLALSLPRYVPIIVVILPLLLIPLNYYLLLSNQKGWLRIAIPILSFDLSLATGQFLIIILRKVLPGLPLSFPMTLHWVGYLIIILVLLTFLLIFQGIYQLLNKIIYGDVNRISRNLLREGFTMRQTPDEGSIMAQMARVFIRDFYRFSYLNICLIDGTVLQFDEENQLRLLEFDESMMKKLIEKIAVRQNLHTDASLDDRIVSTSTIERIRFEFPEIFGDDPRYCYLLNGSQAPIGLIAAGDRKREEPFDNIETQHLLQVLSQYQIIVENLLLLKQQEKASHQIRLSGQQMIQTREDERRRIARDMHDNIIQAITAFRFQLNELYDSDKLSISDMEADELQHNLLNITQDIRDICFGLRPPALDATGMQSAVVSLVESYHSRNELFIDVKFEGEKILNTLAEEIAICLYRVLQESLLNIVRHANTKFAHIVLSGAEDQVLLQVSDDGKGFNVPNQINELVLDGHFGLLGAQEFLDSVNGTFTVKSSPGKGATINALIPLMKKDGENGVFYDYHR